VKEKNMNDQKEQLIPLLSRAAQRFVALGHQEIDYTDELGKLCNQAADTLTITDLSDEQKKRLYFIFAPTCAWDDSVGDADLGNKIFEHLEVLCRDVSLMK
jgi:hypothetical protein